LTFPLENFLSFSFVFPVEELCINRFLVKEYGMDWEVGNYAFGAAAGHPFLKAIIDNCIRAQQHPDWANEMLKSVPRVFRREWLVLATTGPGLVSRTLAEYPVDSEQVQVLFPEDVRDPNNWHCFGGYGVHLQIGNWRRRERLVRRVLHRNWELRERKALLKKSFKRRGKRTLEFKGSS
jgi:hypothetical protein